jgi:hypothetical protein
MVPPWASRVLAGGLDFGTLKEKCLSGPPTAKKMQRDRAIFQDELGRGWLVEIQYGHPAPAELGIYAARFRCPEDPGETTRLGYVQLDWVAAGDENALRMALAESDPASPIG